MYVGTIPFKIEPITFVLQLIFTNHGRMLFSRFLGIENTFLRLSYSKLVGGRCIKLLPTPSSHQSSSLVVSFLMCLQETLDGFYKLLSNILQC